MPDISELRHQAINSVVVIRSLIQQVEKHTLEINALQGKIAYRLGFLEESFNLLKGEEGDNG